MSKVYIGVGHGGSDAGAVANGFRESDLNLSVAKACYDYLKSRGVDVKISRTKDVDVWIATKVKEANAFGADLALDIHHNAGGGDGAEVYYSISGGTSKKLAETILAEMGKIGQNSRGAKIKKNASGTDYFGFIRQTNMPSVLVECAFMDNKKDLAIVDTAAERVKMGEAIAKAILIVLGVADKKVTTIKSDKIVKGAVVSISKNAEYYDGTTIPSWVCNKNWIVKENPNGDRVVIDKSTDGKNSICSAISSKYLTVVSNGSVKKPTATTATIKEGSKVRVKSGAKTYTGGALASFVYKTTYTVLEKPQGNRVVIGLNGVVTAAINKNDLILV